MLVRHVWFIAIISPCCTLAQLKVERFAGASPHGTPISSSTVDSLDLTLGNFTGGVAVSGQIVLPKHAASFYAFDCTFQGGQIAYVWIDDHLVCHTDPPFGNTASSTDGSVVNPLVGAGTSTRHVLVHIASASLDGSGRVTSGPVASVSVRWAGLAAPLAAGAAPHFESIPSSLLEPARSPLESQRRALQDGLKNGWNLWGYNLIGLVRLPDSSVLTTALCTLSTAKCLTATRIEDPKAAVRVGPFAIDQSYWQLYLGFEGLNVSISVAGGHGPLHLLVEPLNCGSGSGSGSVNCSDFELVMLPRYQWFRPGGVTVATSGAIQFSPMGYPKRTVQPTAAPSRVALTPSHAASPRLSEDDEVSRAAAQVRFSLSGGPLGFSEGDAAPPSVAQVQAVLASARAAELRRYEPYGALAEVKEALQAAVLWNYVVSPAEAGPFLPVSRSWNFVKKAASADFACAPPFPFRQGIRTLSSEPLPVECLPANGGMCALPCARRHFRRGHSNSQPLPSPSPSSNPLRQTSSSTGITSLHPTWPPWIRLPRSWPTPITFR